MSLAIRKKKKKDPVTHVLAKELIISVTKVTEMNKWTPVLQTGQTPTLCFEGYVSRTDGQKRRYTTYKTQPLDVRLGRYLFRQVNGEVCSLEGELYDPSNNIPLAVKAKFKNGIPKQWRMMAKFWDNIQKHSFCGKQLRSFSSRIAWVESLKSSGVLRVSSRGRIIIPSPKYLKGKNVEQRDDEKAHLINSQLNMIRSNMDFTPLQKIDEIRCTPRLHVESNCNTINGNKSYHSTICENPTENPLSKSNFSHKISEHGNMQAVQILGSHMKNTRRSSINQRKLITCKRKLIVDEVQSKMCRSRKTSKKTYEKLENKYHHRCLPHRRKYLLRSSPATKLLKKKSQCKKVPRRTSVNIRHNSRIVVPQRKQPEQTKRKLNLLKDKNSLQCQDRKNAFSWSKQNQVGKGSKEVGSCNEYIVQDSVLEPEPCSKECRNIHSVNVEKNKRHETLGKFRYKKPYRIVRDIQLDSVLENCANRLRKPKEGLCCQDSCDTERPKKNSENSLPPKANRKGLKTFHGTYEDSGPQLTERKSAGNVEPLLSKRYEEINLESVPAGEKGVLEKKGTPQKISENVSKRDGFSGKSTTSPFNSSKCRQLRLVSNKRQTENRSGAVRNQLNAKELRRLPDRTRKKSLSPSKYFAAITSTSKICAKAIEDTKEAVTTQGKMVNSIPKTKICKNDSKQLKITDLQSSEKTEPHTPSKDTLGTRSRKSGKIEPNLSLGPESTDRKSVENTEPLLSKRKKSLSTSKSSAAVTSTMKINAEALEDTKEVLATQGRLVSSVSKRKICKNDSKQPRILDLQSSEKTEPSVPSKDTLKTQPRKTELNLSLDDIDDILTTGAPRTLKQRKKLRKTIDSYAKTQTTSADLFSDPDYNHLIGDNDPCSSQEWDKDYAEAIEKLVSGKLADQMSLGSTSPARYLQDFVCDDNQSVRSTSPFERTPCDEEFKLRYEHRVLKERNERTRRKSLNMDLLSSFANHETDASTEAEAAYNALIQGKPVPPKLFDLKCKKNNNSSDDSSSECSDDL